ncbi:AAA family ATPase [Marinicella litoralis]|uniref:Type II secretion system protein A n=1 Tax=Marinicella litoralis TaxID=644220 RepID=A0A4V3DI35_9GAMM|nr:AAA family ATPase [Marinicella litoralis]TDR20561.1 type II secretion system protein A [Marinicella litoralis]
MYLEFFDLQQAPFSITPDPEFVYLSEKHQESLAHLIYGVTRGGGAGFVQLTGEVGTGKTTISRLFLQKLPTDTHAALILNPNITPTELLENIFKEFKISTRGIKGKLNAMVEKLNEKLLLWWADGKNTLILIDEAQNIPRDTLEQLRLLTNLETDQQKLLQIILIGQPELKQLMQRKDLRQLAQRITSRFHLQPLSNAETIQYIKHRVAVSGGPKELFSNAAIKKIFKQTQGIPRLINVLCDRALLVAFAKESPSVGSTHVRQAIQEVYPDQKQGPEPKLLLTLVVLAILFVSYWLWPTTKPQPQQEVTHPQQLQQAEVKIDLPIQSISWQKYLSLWQADQSLIWNENRCPDVSTIGMGCLRKQGNLTQIQQQNTPVLLELNQGQLALLIRIDSNTATLVTTTGEQAFDHSLINQRWFGHYFVLWPMASELIDDTISSTVNGWALNVAKVIDNNPNLPATELNDWIIDFQSSNGLLADGIIGKETQMALSLKAYKGPNLTE